MIMNNDVLEKYNNNHLLFSNQILRKIKWAKQLNRKK